MKYFAYYRKSTDEPDNQLQSLVTQKRITDSVMNRDSLEVLDEFSEAISAKTAGKRPLFSKMLSRIRSGEAEGILVAHLDRLTRNGTESAQIISLFELGLLKEIRTGSKIYNSGEDILYMDFDFAFASHFSRQLSKKVKEGMETKRLKGEFPNRAPIGYKNRDGRIYPDPKFAPFIKRTFSLYLSGEFSLKQLALQLYDEGFRTRDAGRKVSTSTIHEILRNPVYYGAIRSHGKLYKGIHTPLVTREAFDRAQLLLSGKGFARMHKLDFQYRGLLRCAVCGCAMTATMKKGRYVYYYCTNGKGVCSQHRRYLPEVQVHDLLRSSVASLTLEGGFVELAFSTYADGVRQATAAGTHIGDRVRKEIVSVDQKIERLLDLYLEKKIDGVTYEAKKTILTNEKVSLELQLQRKKSEDPARTLELVKNFTDYACSLTELFDDPNSEVRVKMLKSILWNLSVKDGEVASKQYKAPYQHLEEMAKTRDLKTWYPHPDSNRRSTP